MIGRGLHGFHGIFEGKLIPPLRKGRPGGVDFQFGSICNATARSIRICNPRNGSWFNRIVNAYTHSSRIRKLLYPSASDRWFGWTQRTPGNLHIFTFTFSHFGVEMFTENHIFIYIFINIYININLFSRFFVNCNNYKKWKCECEYVNFLCLFLNKVDSF